MACKAESAPSQARGSRQRPLRDMAAGDSPEKSCISQASASHSHRAEKNFSVAVAGELSLSPLLPSSLSLQPPVWALPSQASCLSSPAQPLALLPLTPSQGLEATGRTTSGLGLPWHLSGPPPNLLLPPSITATLGQSQRALPAFHREGGENCTGNQLERHCSKQSPACPAASSSPLRQSSPLLPATPLLAAPFPERLPSWPDPSLPESRMGPSSCSRACRPQDRTWRLT